MFIIKRVLNINNVNSEDREGQLEQRGGGRVGENGKFSGLSGKVNLQGTVLTGWVIHCLVLDYFPDDVQKLREKGIRFDALDAQEGMLKLADFGNAVHFGTVGSSSYQKPPPKRSNGKPIPSLAMDRWRVRSREAEDESPTASQKNP
ncbi:hypothetical protein TELCIR_08412 [Teladorsagia circumcincta]|uniref:Protein kinase domain-containing protein n=1 Tax=Teladorsagia circumcincta TaxID=45464 RepID=A0A2G9UHU7_TELCI|nr:hypothetical protein TELCIR_08412 [Teladorsagia circumcincta]